jgi:hypothetical protein
VTSPEKVITVVRRARRVAGLRPYAAVAFVLAGLTVLGIELGRYWLANHLISGGVIAIGASISFTGFYLLDHADAKDGAQFLVTSAVSLVTAVRGGRRATDAVVVAETTPVAGEEKAS